MPPSSDPDQLGTGQLSFSDTGSGAQVMIEDLRSWFARRERALWTLVIVVFLADLALTLYGFELGFDESNPVAVWLLARFGVVGIVALKVGVLLMALVFRWVIPEKYGVIVPLALVLPWTYAVLVNLVVIATAG